MPLTGTVQQAFALSGVDLAFALMAVSNLLTQLNPSR